MKQILADSSPGGKIFYLFLFSFIGLMIGGSLLTLILGAGEINSETSVWGIHVSTLIQSLFMFILPAWLVVAWSNSSPKQYLALTNSSGLAKAMIFGVLAFVLSYAFISFLNQWNKAIELPQALQPIEQWMRALEDSAVKTTERLLSGKSPLELIANLFFVAVLAAVSEELFFRGALQQFLHEMTKSGHAAVWISSFIFSAIHLQFYGFFPRLLLGALLGYLFLYTRNLWVPILVHFINNAAVIIITYFWGETEWFRCAEEMAVTPAFAGAALVSAVATSVLFFIYTKRSPKPHNS